MTDSETHVLSVQDLPSHQHTPDNERIAELENKVSMLRDALIGLASGQMISLDGKTGDPVVVASRGFTATVGVSFDHYPSLPSAPPNNLIVSTCNQSPYAHHYRMPSGLCACQDKSWAQ